jgi:hypothetical protein
MPALTPRRAAILLALGTLALATTASAQPWVEGQSRAEAQAWAQMLDKGRYEDAWDAMSSPFKEGKSKLEWMRQQKDGVEERGPLSTRVFMSSVYFPAYPVPGTGATVVAEQLAFASVDKDKNRWVEVMLMVREKGKDGPWTVAEYEPKPNPLEYK